MASNFIVNGVGDLDTIFSTTSPGGASATNFIVGTTDLNARYQVSSLGSTDQINFNTGFKSGSTDLRYIFRAASYSPAPSDTAFLADHTISQTPAAAPGSAVSKYRLNTNGACEKGLGVSGTTYTTFSGEWLTAGSANAFEGRLASVSSGTFTSGPSTGTWNDLGAASAEWVVVYGGGTAGSKTAVGVFEIRRKSDSVVVATATISLSAALS